VIASLLEEVQRHLHGLQRPRVDLGHLHYWLPSVGQLPAQVEQACIWCNPIETRQHAYLTILASIFYCLLLTELTVNLEN
jgi:hypothetical protein